MLLRLKNRRGATMILFVVALLGFLGIMAYAIDFGRMYLFRTQVHTRADAAALAGVQARFVSIDPLVNAAAADTAVSVGRLNLVENRNPSMTTADIVPGVWTFPNGPFTPAAGGSWTASGINAVQATARDTAGYVFGPIFSVATRVRSAISVAAVGSVGSTDCVRPWAIPYQVMLDVLYGTGVQNAGTYNLTAGDVATLSAMTIANNMFLKIGDPSATVTNGSFYGVRLPPILYANGTLGNPWNGANDYGNAIGYTCAQLNQAMIAQGGSPNIGVGDWLQSEQGNMVNKTRSGVLSLCNNFGGGTIPGNPGGSNSFACVTPASVKIAMWASYGDAPGTTGCGGKCFLVKYLGVFAVTGYTKATGGNPDGVTGYFSSLLSSGSFSGAPGPIKKIALVQ